MDFSLGSFRKSHTSSIVLVPGVWTFSMASISSSAGTSSTQAARSLVAAMSQLSQYAISLSPTSDSAVNSCELLPPIAPLSASTGRKVSPQRVKIFVYASYISW